MKHIVGVSGGIDSQAAATWVLNRYPKEDVILTNSTAGRNEHPMTVAHVNWFSEAVHPVVIVEAIYADLWETPGYAEKRGYKSDDILTFGGLLEVKKRPPSRSQQFCTTFLKLKPMVRWVKANVTEPYVRYSGLRRDESDPRKDTPPRERDDCFDCEIIHPIFDWTKQMCFDYCKAQGQQINPLYTLGFTRVGCAPCINSGREDIRRWAKRFPEMIEKVREWERIAGCTFFPPMIGARDHNNFIDEVVEWANCERGGKQYSLEVIAPAPVCESAFGLCE